jgi:hypothetical protein
MAKAVVRALAVNAARGQLRSQQLFEMLLSDTGSVDQIAPAFSTAAKASGLEGAQSNEESTIS